MEVLSLLKCFNSGSFSLLKFFHYGSCALWKLFHYGNVFIIEAAVHYVSFFQYGSSFSDDFFANFQHCSKTSNEKISISVPIGNVLSKKLFT